MDIDESLLTHFDVDNCDEFLHGDIVMPSLRMDADVIKSIRSKDIKMENE